MLFYKKIPILDYDVVRMFPRDLIGLNNRGTKGFRLGQKSSENQYPTSKEKCQDFI